MDILVSQVRKGDYVDGLGTVTDVSRFYRESAVKTKISPLNRKRIPVEDKVVYARIVAEQQEQAYESLLDNVVLYSAGGVRKTYSPEKTVKVYRVMREAV